MSTHWLTAEEQRTWVQFLATTGLLDAALDRQLQRESALTHAQYTLIAILSMAPEHTMHMNELAALTASSQSRLSHAVGRLESAGWVTRRRCTHNRRLVHATLTDAGAAKAGAAAPGHVEEVRRLVFDHLSAEQVRQLRDITDTLLQVLDGEGYATPPPLPAGR